MQIVMNQETDIMENQQFQQPPQQNNSKGGLILCIISLICMFGVPSIGGLITNISSSGDISSFTDNLNTAYSLCTGGSCIAAWVLAIIARVKYKNTFSKVLIIVYSIVTVLFILAIVLIVMACASCVSSGF